MITATAELQTLAQNPVRRPTAKVFVMWDGSTWTDESQRLKNVTGFEEMGGGVFETGSGEVDLTFINDDYHFTVGHPNCDIRTEYMVPRRLLRVEIGFNDENLTRFYGYVESYVPDVKSGEFRVHAFDRSYQMKRINSGYVWYENVTVADLIRELGYIGGLTDDEMEIDSTSDTIEFAYFEDNTIWFLMGQLAAAEGGRVFFNNENKLVFWNRFHIGFDEEPVFTFLHSDYILDQPYEISDKDIKNVIHVTSESRRIFEEQVIWDVADESKDEFRRVYAHNGNDDNDLRFNVTLANPVTDFVRPLVAYTDYEANSEPDGSGTDLTGDITFEDLGTFIKGLLFRIRYNDTSGIAYLTTLQVRGTPAKVFSKIDVTVTDAYSTGLYGSQIKEIDNPYIDSFDFASALAEQQLSMFANTLSNFSTEVIAIPWIEPGDICAFQIVPESEEVRPYLITSVRWTWEPRAGAKLVLGLAINFSSLNRLEDTLIVSGESHDFDLVDDVFQWGPGGDNPLPWNLGSWG